MSNRSDEDPGVYVGQLVRDLRIEKGLTQDNLAEALGSHLGTPVHKTMVSKIENGSRSVSLREAVGLSEVLGVSLRDLSAPYAYPGVDGLKARVLDEMLLIENSLNNTLVYADGLRNAARDLLDFLGDPEGNEPPTSAGDVERQAARADIQLADEAVQVLYPLTVQVRNKIQSSHQAFGQLNGRP